MANWDTTTPAGSDLLSQGDDRIREMKTAIQTALRAGEVAGDDVEGVEAVFPGASPSTAPVFRYRGLKGTTAERPTAGQYGLYFDTTRQVLQRDNGTNWEDVGQVVTDGSITEAKLSASVAGAGLVGGANVPLAVNVDNSTMEVNSDVVRLKDYGITQEKLAFPVFSFGTGTDGSLSVSSGTTVVDGIKKYTDVTISAGATLTTSNARALTMFVSGTLTINGSINVNGKGTFVPPTIGGYCGSSGAGGGGGGDGDANTESGSSGNSSIGCLWASGATGGNGGAAGSNAGGPGGNGSIQSYVQDQMLFHGDMGYPGQTGGNGAVNEGGSASGGAGGNGGGCVKIFAKNIVFGGSGSITANGLNGSSGQNGGDPSGGPGTRGGGGGGGGGSGGCVILVYNQITGTPTVTASGGSGGAGGSGLQGNGGGSGGTGANGTVLLFETL